MELSRHTRQRNICNFRAWRYGPFKKKNGPEIQQQDTNFQAKLLLSSINLGYTIPFISQFWLEKPKVACARACQAILQSFFRAKQAERNEPHSTKFYGSKESRITVAVEIALSKKLKILPEAKRGIDYIDEQLSLGNPIMVGVNHTIGKTQSDGWAADHYVIIVGRDYDKHNKKLLYRFMEVGTKWEFKGRSDKNQLFLNIEDYSLTGTNADGKRNFTVTEVRVN